MCVDACLQSAYPLVGRTNITSQIDPKRVQQFEVQEVGLCTCIQYLRIVGFGKFYAK